jgi:hypothetical protein
MLLSSNFPDVVFRGGLSMWIAYSLIGLGVVAVIAVYFRESMKLHPALRILMALLRGAAIASIILLLCKPVIVSHEAATRPRPVALLVDNSQSMRQRDPRTADADIVRNGIARNLFAPEHDLTLSAGESDMIPENERTPTRADVAMAVFRNPRLNLRDELRAKGPLQEYLFGSQLHGAGNGWVNNLEANESKTSLLYSVSQVLQRDDNELPAAIVIATDGLDNDRERTINWDQIGRECARLKVPLHIYGVGGGIVRFLQLRSVETNPRDTLIAESSVGVTFRWTCQGIKDGMIELNVKLGNHTVASKRVPAKEGEEIVETLSFIPKKEDATAGKVDLEGTISVVGGRKDDRDQLTQNVRVVESKIKVLYVESAPRWEFKFLLRALQGDRIKSVDANFLLVNGDERTLKAGPPFLPVFPRTQKELAAYDMLIIGDVNAAYFTPEQQRWIVEFVDEGGGLVVIAGRQQNPASYVNTPIGKCLPVEFDAVKFAVDENKAPDEYVPKIADIGRYESVMSLGDSPEENRRVWNTLPAWFWHYPVKKLKPGAQSLLDHPKETIEDPSPLAKNHKRPMPLIARHFYGRGAVMFIGGDETWRWRFNEEDKYFARFWGQVMYQMGLPHVLTSKTQMTAEGDFIKGKPTKVYARLFTHDHRPLEVDRIEGTLDRAASGKIAEATERVAFNPIDGQPGLYMTTITKDQPGDYNLRLPQGQSSSDPIVLPVRVILSPEDELAPGNLNEAALKRLAEQTGGKFYRENDLKDLPGAIESKVVYLDPPPRKEILLWTRWWALAGVVGLLTAEWLIRKFCNLS